MFCKNCGTQNPDGTKFCSKCGQPLDAAQPAQSQTVIIQQTVQPKPKKNGGALACGIIGFILAVIGSFIWVLIFSAMKSCADAINLPSSEVTIRLVVIAILGIGGAIVGIAGAAQAFKFNRIPGIVCTGVGFACQLGSLIAQVVDIGFIALFSIWTIFALILFGVAFGLSFLKPKKD